MSNTGSHFLSTGFDRYIRYWDVETGQAAGTYSNRKIDGLRREILSPR
jgi:WD40 repeat protein